MTTNELTAEHVRAKVREALDVTSGAWLCEGLSIVGLPQGMRFTPEMQNGMAIYRAFLLKRLEDVL